MLRVGLNQYWMIHAGRKWPGYGKKLRADDGGGDDDEDNDDGDDGTRGLSEN